MMKSPAKNLACQLLQAMLASSFGVVAACNVLMAEPLKKGDILGGGMIVFVEQSNTKAPQQHGIIAAFADLETQLSWSDAKATCDSLTLKGFTDWTLPAKDELNRLFLSKEALGGFQGADYWSSSSIEPDSAWSQQFFDGKEYIRSRESRLRVRPIRKF